MRGYKLTAREQSWVTQLEPLIMEFAGGLDREEAEDWYFECAELLCDLAHNYCEECRRAGVAPIFESYHDQAMQTLLIKSCCMDQLAAAMDAFRCRERCDNSTACGWCRNAERAVNTWNERNER